MKTKLRGLAAWLARPKAANVAPAPRATAMKAGALTLILAAAGFFLGVPYRAVFASFPRARPSVTLRTDRWSVLYRSGVTSPDDPALWTSPPRPPDAEHAARLRALRGKDFWIGIRVMPEDLARACAARANLLYLGVMTAHFRVYADGALLLESMDDRMFRPATVAVPFERLGRRKPLDVAIHLFHDFETTYPDGMSGDPDEIGFYDHERHQILDQAIAWGADIRPAVFFGVNLLAATAFMFLWLGDPRKREYFWVGSYLCVETLIQGWGIWSLRPLFGLALAWGVPFVYHVWEGALALALGLSYARMRREVFVAALAPLLLLPLAIFAYHGDVVDFLRLNRAASLCSPVLCALGACCCFLQSLAAPAAARRRRLALFGGGLLVIGLAFLTGATGFVDPHQFAYWHRLGHLGVILLMGWLIAREHREQDLKNEEARAAAALALQVAHDIRSPLAALKILKSEAADLPDGTRELLQAAIDRIDGIADSMLEQQRAAAAPTGGMWVPLDIVADLARRIAAEKKVRLGARPGLRLEVESSGRFEGLATRTHPTDLGRLLSNMIDNALEASDDEGFVRVLLDAGPRSLELRIEDRGRGIPAHILPLLCEKGGSYGKARGNGLGLYHARCCIESWGGSLRIESEPGQGTRMRITLRVEPHPV